MGAEAAGQVATLPDTEPQAWDDLMRQSAYCNALDLLV